MNTAESLLSDLNSEQRAAVTFGEGPLLIVAGAGTGKTTVITRRIAWLIESGKCKPDEILAVTFTEKAAAEMEERADRLLPYGYVNLWVMTFHAFCERILQRHGLDIGIPNDFKLLDTTAAWLLVRKNLERFDLDYYRPLGNPAKFIHALLKHFSRAKDEDILPAQYAEYAQKLSLDEDQDPGSGIEDRSRISEIARAYHVYEQLLIENNALDFGSLISHTLRLFRQRPAVLQKYRDQFKYILVDEFQDTNLAQYELVKMLAAPKNNLSILSDDDQSIFRFRGASYHNIIQFKKDFPESREISLIQNYRSCQNILDCAYTFIQHNNPNRLEWQLQNGAEGIFQSGLSSLSKKLVAQTKGEGPITYIHCATQDEEVDYVISQIVSLKNSDPALQWSDFAILVRANASAQGFIARLKELDIPYQFLSLRGLYTKSTIIDLLSYLRLLDNHHESPSLYRVLSWGHFGIGQKTIIELTHYAHQKGISLREACQKADAISSIDSTEKEKIAKIINLLSTHASLARSKRPSEVLLTVIRDTGYLDQIKSGDTTQKRECLQLLNQLYKKMHGFSVEYPDARLTDFLILVSYEQEAGDEGRLSVDLESGPDTVKILTVHAAKGLEFPYVFIVGMVDRRFPTSQRDDAIGLPSGLVKESVPEGDVHLQEERRLFYVALTRAKKGVHLTSAHDYGGARAKKPSQFLYEIGLLTSKEPTKDIPRSVLHTSQEKQDTPPTPADEKLLPLPTVFSFTQLTAFRTCPLQYKFSFILKIPVFGKPQLSFGKTIHLTLQRFMELVIEQGSRTQGGLFSQDKKGYTVSAPQIPPLQVLFDLYDKNWNDDWYYNIRQKEEYRTRGKEMLTRFYEELVTQGMHTKAVERDFTMKFGSPSNLYSLKGRIDRVDRKDDGTVAIVDYKTGSPKQEEKLVGQDKEQLLLYQIASQEVFDEKPSELTYYYLENGKKISFLGTEKEIETVKKKVVDTISEIQKSDFSATPGWHCKSCDFKDICEWRQL